MIRNMKAAIVATALLLVSVSHGLDNRIKFGGGYKNPTGLGLEYSLYNDRGLGGLVGVGIWMDGIHAALGARKYFLNEKRFNPLAEVAAYYSTGTPWISGSFNGEKGEFRFGSGAGLNLGAGVRWNIWRMLGLQWVLGYQAKLLEPDLEMKSLVGDGKKSLEGIQASGIYLEAGLQIGF